MNLDFFYNRRTIRNYADTAIDIDRVREMLEAAANAPTTGGMQLYSAIITTDNQIKNDLAECHFNQPAAKNAPAIITFCADFNRFIKWCELGNAEPGFDNFQSFVAAMLDTAIFAQQFCTIAESEGFGCCYLGTTTYNAPQIAKILNLPNHVVPIVALSIGIPYDQTQKCERLPLKGIVHSEKYHDYSDANIAAIYKGKEDLPANKKFVEDNGKSHLSQVFTDVRYPKDTNETFSRIFLNFIEIQGFKL